MKLGPLVIGKDGGQDSTVDGVMLEFKSLFSIGLLRFKDGSREAWHSHAFDCVSLLLKGELTEQFLDSAGEKYRCHTTGDVIKTHREDCHKVISEGTSYVLTFRGPWAAWWVDVECRKPYDWTVKVLENGRVVTSFEGYHTRASAVDLVRRLYEPN